MSVDKTKVEQAFELLSQANSLIQSSGLVGEVDGVDVVYVIHNLLENTCMEIEDALDAVGYY